MLAAHGNGLKGGFPQEQEGRSLKQTTPSHLPAVSASMFGLFPHGLSLVHASTTDQKMALTSLCCPCGSPALVALLLLCLSHSFNTHLAAAAASAANTLRPGQSITGNQTLISNGGTFELGFFSPGGNSRNWFLGIWFLNIPEKTVVWVANREAPLGSPTSSELTISGAHGQLVLLNAHKIPVWSTPSSSFRPRSPNSTLAAVLLDTGNLVLKDGEDGDGVLWQSFDHPADTLLPGQRYGFNKTEGRYWSFTSWRNSEDPSPGWFCSSLDPRGPPQSILVWNKTRAYYASGFWDGRTHSFASVPEMMRLHEYSISFFSSSNASYFTYTDHEVGARTIVWMDISGQWKWRKWSKHTQYWVVFSALPRDPCDVYSGCGPFGICSSQTTAYCRCPPGFRPKFPVEWGLGDHTEGCVRETQLECGSTKRGMEDGFQLIPYVRPPPMGFVSLVARSVEECESACLNDCLCMAYSYNNGCLVWKGDLMNMKQVFDAGDGGQSTAIYLRLAAAGLSSSRGKKKMKIIVTLCVAGGIVVFVCSICVALWRCRKKKLSKQTSPAKDFLVPFRYKEIKRMTKNFSEKLGEGGFGRVYKGVLLDSSVVAVKCLKNLGHREKQFRTELCAMGAIHHVNILRLRGFCCEGTKRVLVYDYMSNRSLDSYLSPKSCVCLDWNKRYQIALGIAKGLLYLHEECRECIMHCDIKPENVLLDETLSPKVADFGMAKLMGKDFSRVMTTTRGTIGYLAPEWIAGVSITPKVDVYSFGMMLFELISGSRNGVQFEFPLWAINHIGHYALFNFPDIVGGDFSITEQFIRACQVACWCVQDCENDRPSMGQVVQMLEGALEIEEPPIPGRLQWLGAVGDVSESDSSSISQYS